MNKVTIYEKLLDGLDKYDRVKFILRVDNNTLQISCENENKDDRSVLQTKLEDNLKNEKETKKYFCAHGKYKYSCRTCQGILILLAWETEILLSRLRGCWNLPP